MLSHRKDRPSGVERVAGPSPLAPPAHLQARRGDLTLFCRQQFPPCGRLPARHKVALATLQNHQSVRGLPCLRLAASRETSMRSRMEAGCVVAGKYELAWLLGRGSTGEVWVAHHKTLGQDVAIKLLKPAPGADERVEEAAKADARFHFEARIAALLSRRTRHIVVGVIDHGEEDHEALVEHVLPQRPWSDANVLDAEILRAPVEHRPKVAVAVPDKTVHRRRFRLATVEQPRSGLGAHPRDPVRRRNRRSPGRPNALERVPSRSPFALSVRFQARRGDLPRAVGQQCGPGWRLRRQDLSATLQNRLPGRGGRCPGRAGYREGVMRSRIDTGYVVAGKYELAWRLGRGSTGEVWVAHHKTLGQDVAIKLLQPAPGAGERVEELAAAASRFHFEAQVAAQLSRKTRHIVGVIDHGEEDGLAFLVMELPEGETLEAELARGARRAPGNTTTLISQIARALTEAHAVGVMHRDLKPANIFLSHDEDGYLLVKLLDFGIARAFHTLHTPANIATGEGLIFGTAGYMSPEQAFAASKLDHRCDLWALATVAYEVLTGELPVCGSSAEELLGNVCAGRIVPVHSRDPLLPTELAGFFERAFAPRLDERFASASELARAFERAAAATHKIESHAGWRARWPWRTPTRAVFVATAAVLVGLTVAAIAWYGLVTWTARATIWTIARPTGSVTGLFDSRASSPALPAPVILAALDEKLIVPAAIPASADSSSPAAPRSGFTPGPPRMGPMAPIHAPPLARSSRAPVDRSAVL
jgi:serine/threonine protein kinase